MVLNQYPIGLIARTNYFRVTDTRWNNEGKEWILSRMKASPNNIKPVIIINHTTKKTTCEFPNAELTGFNSIEKTGEIITWCARVERIADWHLNKEKLQGSIKSAKDKEIIIKLLVKKFLKFETLTTIENNKIKDI